MGKLTIEQIKQFHLTTYGRMIGKKLATQVMNELIAYKQIEEELGVDLITFLTECQYVLNNCSMTSGKMTNGKEIKTDFGYVEDFIREIKEGLNDDK